MLKVILGLVVLAVVVVLLLAMTKPSTYHVERSITIQAQPDTIAAQVNDFHNWKNWSPWAKLDPAMTESYSGAPSGVGSVYHWKGNSKVGEGEMTILSTMPEKSTVKLDFIKPFEGHNTAEFLYGQTPNGYTNVRWTMDGAATFMTKVMMVFTSMDKMIGPDFEKGLAQLKTEAEKK